jgi:hypothetical protein
MYLLYVIYLLYWYFQQNECLNIKKKQKKHAEW